MSDAVHAERACGTVTGRGGFVHPKSGTTIPHWTWDELEAAEASEGTEFVFCDAVAELHDVKPGTVRVWTHRGKLHVAAYVFGDFSKRARDEGEADREAVYRADEVLALASARGIQVTDQGYTCWAACTALGVTEAELAVLVAAGEVALIGRHFGGPRYDLTEYAKRYGLDPEANLDAWRKNQRRNYGPSPEPQTD